MPDTDQDRAPEPERGPAPQKDELSTAELAQSTDPRTYEPRSFTQEGGKPAPLLDPKEVDELRGNWESIQIGFVDEPRKAVEGADHLVALTMKRLAETFAAERSGLEKQWDRGDKVSTEDLRLALQRYRSFFDRLLSV
jgi:hypothetical protein